MSLLPTISEWLEQSSKSLGSVGISTARLDCLVLLEDVTHRDRSSLLAHSEELLQLKEVRQLNRLLSRRAQHQPLAYIRGRTEFYGREFTISPDVLEPRPESETMLDLLRTVDQPRLIIDVGTGSGALAITVKLLMPETTVIATDIDPNCLRIASKNARRYGAKLTFEIGDLLEPVQHLDLTDTVLLCNLPYVPDSFQINPAAMAEPRVAIFGGSDGLDVYRHLFNQIAKLVTKPPCILTEALPPQHPQLTEIAGNAGYQLVRSEDFIQLFRIFPVHFAAGSKK